MDWGNLLTGIVLWLGLTVLLLAFFAPSSTERSTSQPSKNNSTSDIIALQQQCERLREQLANQSQQLKEDLHQETFEQLQSLLTNYPTACQMARAKPDLPAKNLLSLFTPLASLLENWGYEVIGTPWEQVPYNPQIHQADSDEIQEGDLVYIRFVGYKNGNDYIYPAKVSLNPPPQVS